MRERTLRRACCIGTAVSVAIIAIGSAAPLVLSVRYPALAGVAITLCGVLLGAVCMGPIERSVGVPIGGDSLPRLLLELARHPDLAVALNGHLHRHGALSVYAWNAYHNELALRARIESTNTVESGAGE